MTTMIQIVTAAAIIMASDSKIIDNAGKDMGTIEKISRLSKSTAIASCDLSVIDAKAIDNRIALLPRTYEFKYDFLSWSKQFESISDPMELADAVAAAAEKEFQDYGILVEANAFQKKPYLAEFYTAGYDLNGIAHINKILIPLDWDNARVLPPKTQIVTPIDGHDPTWYFNGGCSHDSIEEVKMKTGFGYDRAHELEPVLVDKLLSAQDLTIDEAKRLATALITVESEKTPSMVGLPVHIVVIERPPVHH